MKFTEQDMIEALEKIGYVVKTEKEPFEVSKYGNTDSVEERVVINVYYRGDAMAIWAGAGSRRLEYVFEQELKKKMLGLF